MQSQNQSQGISFIPTSASQQQLSSLRRQRHASELIESAKESLREELTQHGSIDFKQAQRDVIQSCMVMSKMLEKLEGMAPASHREHMVKQTAITRHQLKNLISDMTHYNISAD
jgi:hypothetical protein